MRLLDQKKIRGLHMTARRVYRSLYFPPLVIFIAMLLVTYWSYRASQAYIQRDQNIAINNKRDEVATTIYTRLATYEQILSGGAGLFRASQEVTEQEWYNYMTTYDIANRYPGVQTVGYIKVLPASQLESVTQSVRAQGFPDFNVKPYTPRDVYSTVLYTMPNRRSPGQGTDLYTDPPRRQAMEHARDGGTATLTPPLRALFDTTSQPVFQLFVAEYEEAMPTQTRSEREAALRGYIFASFRAEDFFNQLLLVKGDDNDTAFEVVETGKDTVDTFYKTPNFDRLHAVQNKVFAEQDIKVYGQTWKIKYVFNASSLTTSQRRNAPYWIIFAGALLALLLAEVIYLLLKARARELTTQRDRAVDLAKDELLSLASHQLRTPATTVKQYLGMVLQGFAGDLNTTQENLLQKAYGGNERQLRIINEMLHVAKIDSGRITLAMQRTNLGSLLRDVVSDIGPDADKAGHKITLKLPKKAVVLNVDDHMVRMAVENLLSNAVKYTVKRGRIEVQLKGAAHNIHISVRDNGIGIKSADFEKLYKLFTRLNNKQTQTVSGTGVGLYLAKHLVELHGGSIRLASEEGKGSVFTIVLPKNRKKKS